MSDSLQLGSLFSPMDAFFFQFFMKKRKENDRNEQENNIQ